MPQFPLEPKSNIILVSGIFEGPNGTRMVNMVFDTGASITSISYETALNIGMDPAMAKKRIEIVTASGKEYVPIMIVPKLTVLGYTLEGVESIVLNLPPGTRARSLLGLNVLSDFNIALRFLDKLLEISK